MRINLVLIGGNVRNYLVAIFGLVFMSACVSNTTMPTVKAEDYELTCDQLKDELSSLGVKFEEADAESGFTGKNVALGIFYWPGIIFNERQAGRNTDSINKRINHLNKLYFEKCVSKN
jgi:hypothetical protein